MALWGVKKWRAWAIVRCWLSLARNSSLHAPLTTRRAHSRAVNREGHTKRWFKGVSVRADRDAPDRYRVLLDDRHLVTPNENKLWAPSERLAWAVAAEWDGQYPTLRPFTMPLVWSVLLAPCKRCVLGLATHGGV